MIPPATVSAGTATASPPAVRPSAAHRQIASRLRSSRRRSASSMGWRSNPRPACRPDAGRDGRGPGNSHSHRRRRERDRPGCRSVGLRVEVSFPHRRAPKHLKSEDRGYTNRPGILYALFVPGDPCHTQSWSWNRPPRRIPDPERSSLRRRNGQYDIDSSARVRSKVTTYIRHIYPPYRR